MNDNQQDHVSKKSLEIPSFMVMDILEKAQEMEKRGESVIHLEIGEPDFDTPDPVKRAGIAAIEQGRTKYTHSLGLIELRSAIVDHYAQTYEAPVDPDRILVASGTSNALFLILAALLDRGDEVIMSDPCYSCYPNFVSFLGGVPVMIRTAERDRFQISPGEIKKRITDKTQAILINSPANPTGMIVERDVLEEIASFGVPVISDEIYHGLVYEGEAHSILEFPGHHFAINGFSKRHAMTGWRLGYAIVPENFARPMQKMQQNFNISANSFVQWGGIAALREGGPYVDRMRETLDGRRKYMIQRLAAMGLTVAHPPQGAFYVFVNMSSFSNDSLAFALEILEKAKVALTPGMDFGPGGEGYIRFSYANSMENIREGLDRLERFFTE